MTTHPFGKTFATATALLLGLSTAAGVCGSAEPLVPKGPLPVYLPSSTHRVAYSLKSGGDGELLLTVGRDAFRISSQFSTPEPAWRKSSNRYFSFKRES